MAEKSLTGACLCGKITYRVDLPTGTPSPKVALCHCEDCKRNTGTPFSSNLLVPKPTFTYTAGTPKVYTHPSGDLGNELQRHFCGDCGSPLNTQPGGRGVVTVKTGTLDAESRGELGLALEIYCKRREPWVDQIGSVPKAEAMP
ncbi:Mss4-like protein [Aspergillus pseudonomiae]|uniref:Mss4-like protein n=1 Tax=Aspergillus pseudonomiae TaxID=1506151 RepID=A0A5N7CZC1_9EURO|nr:Mss4-like protein [Aspergillus pseudonomiae]KAE8398928.1 Mss4-like protein [Aspergillus pseudonomiae]